MASWGCGGGELARFRGPEVEDPWACMSVPLATGPLGREGIAWDTEVEGEGVDEENKGS